MLEDAWNIGPLPTGAATVREIIEEFYRVWGEGGAEYDPSSAKVHEAGLLRLSSEKAMKVLGWRPIWDLSATLSKTAKWYRRYYQGADARMLSLEDIMRYANCMEY